MVLEKEYFHILEKKTINVSHSWKILHIAIFICIAVAGFSACYCFGKALAAFNFNCILYADIAFTNDTDDDAVAPSKFNTTVIDFRETRWSNYYTCSFCQFMPLVSMLCAVIWGSFFLMSASGGEGYESDLMMKPWRIVAPATLFCIVMIAPITVSWLYTRGGYERFCDNFGQGGCTSDIDIYTEQFQSDFPHFYRYFQVVLICVKAGLFLWLVQLAVLICRMVLVTDFQFNKVTIYKTSNKGEHVSFLSNTSIKAQDV